MKIRSKLIIAAILTIGLTGFAISFTAWHFTQRNELGRVDKVLLAITNSSEAGSSDVITPALDVAEGYGNQVRVSVRLSDGSQVEFDDKELVSVEALTKADLRSAANSPLTFQVGDIKYRLSTIDIGGGDFLIATYSLKYLQEISSENVKVFSGISIAALLLGSSVVALVIRRDVVDIERVSKFAQKVSEGDLHAEFKSRSKTPEIMQMSLSLNKMIQYLTAALTKEREMQTSIKEFLGDASHELKTPLTVIKGYNELLATQRTNLTSAGIEAAHGNIANQVERMEALVKDLLLLTEIDATDDVMNNVVNFSELVMHEMFEFSDMSSREVQQVSVAEDLWVQGSEFLLQRLVSNVFRNIAVHTSAEAPVAVRLYESAGEVKLEIEDGGAGLPDSAYESGIQRFRRFDPSRSRESGGTGLGMSIIASIVQKHRGEVRLYKSQLGGLGVGISLKSTTLDSAKAN